MKTHSEGATSGTSRCRDGSSQLAGSLGVAVEIAGADSLQRRLFPRARVSACGLPLSGGVAMICISTSSAKRV